MLALLVLGTAFAGVPTQAQRDRMTGRFVLAETEEVLRARWEAAVDVFADGLPWAFRGMARHKMKKEFAVCDAYLTRLTDEAFHVQCEGQQELKRRLDNAEGPLVGEDGKTVDVVLVLDRDKVTVTFSGEGGGLVNAYLYDGDVLTVDLVVEGDDLDAPLAWFVRYRRALD